MENFYTDLGDFEASLIDQTDWIVDRDRGAKQVVYHKTGIFGNDIYGTFVGRQTKRGWRVEQHHHSYRTLAEAIAKLDYNRNLNQ